MSRSSTFAFATSIAIVMITIHVYGTSEASGPIATSEYDVAINLTIETDRRRESTPFNATERIVRVTALVGTGAAHSEERRAPIESHEAGPNGLLS
jgi:hypothetical protein